MAVVAHTQQLQVYAAQAVDKLVVGGALCVGVGSHAVEHVGVFHFYVHVVKEIVIHEVAVTLLVSGGETEILVQVHGGDLGKAEVAVFAALDELLVCADGSGARGQAQHAVGFDDDLSGDYVGRTAAHGSSVCAFVDSHMLSS